MKRRDFLSAVAAGTSILATGHWPSAAEEQEELDALSKLPRRPLGNTGLELPMIGFGVIVARGKTPVEVDRSVGLSLDLGIDFFDTAASYGDSEFMLGPVIGPRRERITLATKTRERTAAGAKEEFEKSCELLGTDYFDIFLVHAIQHLDRDVEAAFASGGCMEFLTEKKASGEIRLLGFSAHSEEAALRAMDLYDFDFFYYPVNYVAWYAGEFGPAVLAQAKEQGVPCVALKALARQHWPDDVPRSERCEGCWYQPIEAQEEASLALPWSLSQGIVSALPPGNEQLYRRALTLPDNLAPITPEETERLRQLAMNQSPLFPRG
jgi:aryl-alcohol dehydrogenase-like predicted oxidoreductase